MGKITKPSKLALFITFILLGVGVLSVLLGAKKNNQGEYYDYFTGEWDLEYVAVRVLWMPVTYLLVAFIIRFLRENGHEE